MKEKGDDKKWVYQERLMEKDISLGILRQTKRN